MNSNKTDATATSTTVGDPAADDQTPKLTTPEEMGAALEHLKELGLIEEAFQV